MTVLPAPGSSARTYRSGCLSSMVSYTARSWWRERLHIAGAQRGLGVEQVREAHPAGFGGEQERVRVSVETERQAGVHGLHVGHRVREHDLLDDAGLGPVRDVRGVVESAARSR